ncbi:MAG: extracellular solute-binding protein [Magnetococcales bacterium]|nr:extracellular solute-binding protein [Magnetococcales bacterium]
MTILTKTINRRNFLKKAGTYGLGTATMLHAPYVHTKEKVTLRVLGTHVTLREAIRKQAEKELGFNIEYEPGGSARILQKASTRPQSFDIYEQWSDSINILWRSNAIQPIKTKRIKLWNEINDLAKTGKLTPEAKIGLGDAPFKLLNVQGDRTLGSRFSGEVSFLPYVHNTDSFGYDTRVIPRGKAYDTESWGWLLDERYHGKVALVNAPTIGIFDAALAAEASGLMKFENMGNMTEAEIDQLFKILIDKKQKGQFVGFWNSVPESARFIESGRAAVASMFSPAIADLNQRGIPAVYAAPKEGYRAWHGVMCLSSHTHGRVKDAAYEFMNWWLSGWPGAFVARQGYYISIPERSKPFLSKAEWDYWYDGKIASEDLKGPDGKKSINKGAVRNGGSYWKRFSNVAVWNTVMDNYEYTLPRWYEFLLA